MKTESFRLTVIEVLVLFCREFLSNPTSINGLNWKIAYAWTDNEFKRLIADLARAEADIEAFQSGIDLDPLLVVSDPVIGFDAFRSEIEASVKGVVDMVTEWHQKTGKIPATGSISKAEFDRFQVLFSMTNAIRIDDENGVSGLAVWNDERSIRNGSRILPLTDREIKTIRAGVA